ncbi:MAG: hypothetical protein ABIA04_08140 [Pseudomonadota bacterium]
MAFNLKKLIIDVFNPEKDETVLVLTDLPHGDLKDSPEWQEVRELANKWYVGFDDLSKDIGYKVLPLVTYPATGEHNFELPLNQGSPIALKDAIDQATIVVAINNYSASAPLINFTYEKPDLRAASMPFLAKRMEETALAADYKVVQRRCRIIADLMENIEGSNVRFSTGHEIYFDLRYRPVDKDDAYLHRDRRGMRLCNLPAGEVCCAPYEGERENDSSKTQGQIPAVFNAETVVFEIKENKIYNILGEGKEAEKQRAFFDKDPARRNIAEFAIGCNPNAVIWGNVLEDEKAGFHWAYGRSDHLGGVVGVKEFLCPENVYHLDIVYAKDSPIQVEYLEFIYQNETKKEIIKDKEYLIF